MGAAKGNKQTINDIFEKIKRQNRGSHRFIINELDSLVKLLPDILKINPSLATYIPVRLVTYIECYFKEVVKEFVDNNELYANKLIDRISQIKIDMDFIKLLSGKKITIGSILAQVVSVQKVSSIISLMETLAGNDFKLEISSYLQQLGKDTPSLNDILKALDELNITRNIIVHENTHLNLSKSQIFNFIENTRLIIQATDHFIDKKLYPTSHNTQVEMNQISFNQAEKLKEIIRELILKIVMYMRKKTDKSHIKHFIIFYKSREKSILDYAKFSAASFEGGSMYPLIFNSALYEARIVFLEELKQRFTNYDDEIEFYPLNC